MTEDIFAEKAETSAGHFAMEVFLRRAQNGSLQHQSCVLRSPELETLEEEGGEEEDSFETEVYIKAAADMPHESVRIMVSIVQQDDQDGVDDDSKDVSQSPEPSEIEDIEVRFSLLMMGIYHLCDIRSKQSCRVMGRIRMMRSWPTRTSQRASMIPSNSSTGVTSVSMENHHRWDGMKIACRSSMVGSKSICAECG